MGDFSRVFSGAAGSRTAGGRSRGVSPAVARCVLIGAAVALLHGAADAVTVGTSTTQKAARNDAIGSVPFDELNATARRKITAVTGDPTIFRRMPVELIDSDPEMYLFLVRHPEVVVNIWELMGITQVSLDRTGDFTYDTDDGAGTTSNMELVYGTRDVHIFYGQGLYAGPLLKRKVTGRCVLVLHTGYARQEDGRTLITSRLDVFLQLDQVAADLVAKTLHPLVGRTADHNFAESVRFLGRMSRSAQRNGPGMQTLATRLSNVDPAVRRRFSDLAGQLGQTALRSQKTDDLPAQPNKSPTATARLAPGPRDAPAHSPLRR